MKTQQEVSNTVSGELESSLAGNYEDDVREYMSKKYDYIPLSPKLIDHVHDARDYLRLVEMDVGTATVDVVHAAVAVGVSAARARLEHECENSDQTDDRKN